ncbi:MAG: hypothetical protein HKN42_17080, partial [Granulosicoccus sp.]|nr:hypothetical protein [Granulosicoccus sp.]
MKTARMSASPSADVCAVLPGKLRTPDATDVIARQRLFSTLDELERYPLLWMADAPGSGKTTLIASYLAARELRHMWIMLDPRDSDPETFVHYLNLAAVALEPRCRGQLPELTIEDRRDITGFARRLWRTLAEHLGHHWYLVLDNIHEISDNSVVHQILRVAADELPYGTRLYLVGRSTPGRSYVRSLANHNLVLLERRTLRFTLEETRELLAIHARDAEAPTFLQLSDGWATGLILLLAFDERGDATPMNIDDTSVQHVFDYFASEVFDRLRGSQRLALLRVAMLPHASLSMAESIAGQAHTAAMLESLVKRNLFVDKRSGKEPVYTFHALFRRFLRDRARRQIPTSERTRLSRVAATLLEEDHQLDAALELLFESSDHEAAEALLFRHADDYALQGRFSALLGWLRELPRTRHDTPEHLYWSACCTSADDAMAAETLYNAAYERFTECGDMQGRFLAAAGSAEAVVYRGNDLRKLDRWLDLFESAPQAWL